MPFEDSARCGPQQDQLEKAMSARNSGTSGKQRTAAELRKLPAKQRDAIPDAAAVAAEAEYRNNPELTSFEAFGEEDLHGDSASTETR
jgi:hypothetical protein